MSPVPAAVFSTGGVLVAAIGYYVRNDPARRPATPFLIYLGAVLVVLALVVTFATR